MTELEELKHLLEGQFDNRTQALSNPSRFAYIRVTHIAIGNGKFYGEQAYNYKLDQPYRQFVILPVQCQDGRIEIQNFEIENKTQFIGGKNLDKIKNHMLSLKKGCSLFVKKVGDSFEGEVEGNKCIVEWGGQRTFLTTSIKLTPTHYYVLDKGYDINNPKKQIWGTRNGHFQFVRKQ